MIIAGSTACGKTNLLLNLLCKFWIFYNKVYVWSPTIFQPKYQFLKNVFEHIEENNPGLDKIAHFYNTDDEILDPTELNPQASNVMIFDDCMNRNQHMIKEYFTLSRQTNCNCIYLCQSLLNVPKHGIRENANIFILFKQQNNTLKSFYDSHVSSDMDFNEFKTFCDDAWRKKCGFVVINLWSEPNEKRYIKNYEIKYIPENYL